MKTTIILKIMNILFWIVFIGLCIKTGALLISFFVSLFINPEGAQNLYLGLNLYDLYIFDLGKYIGVASMLIALMAMKAYLAFLVVKLFLKFDLNSPFNENTVSIISKISHYALSIAVVAIIADGYGDRIIKQGILLQIDWGAEEFLFFAGIIYIIALVFKKGVEIQNENELTI